MVDPSEPPTLSPGLKRTHDGQVVLSSTQTNYLAPPQTQTIQIRRSQSPALSSASSSLTEMSSIAPPNPMAGTSGSPTKKQKLTFAERQVKKAEQERLKAEKAQQKVDEQARKDDEKRLKDEEKRKKAEEKEVEKKTKEIEKAEKEAARVEKQKAKDAEKAEKEAQKAQKEAKKEAQKAQKEAEKLKKERAQMRLGAFFGKPALASSPPSTPEDVSSGVSSRRSSITSIDMDQPELDPKTTKSTDPGFRSWILPFFPHDHTEIAPYNRFLTNHDASSGIEWLDSLDKAAETDVDMLKQSLGPAKSRKRQVMPVETIVTKLSGTEQRPVDLTGGSESTSVARLLQHTSYKILSFREDFRPPYQGTFTRAMSPRTSKKLRRNPIHRGMPKVDYDYDSEAEWEAPEAGDEDLEDDDELSDEEEAIDEMADFLDDEEEIARRRVTTSDTEPVCTGLCWEGEVDPIVAGIDLGFYRMDVLSDDTCLPIDPYSTTHWSQTGKTTPAKKKGQPPSTAESTTPAMQPPRLPLAAVSAPNNSPLKMLMNGNSTSNKENEAPAGQQRVGQNLKKPTKTISPDLLPTFKAAVSGSDLNKVALIEILKKQFPKCPKDAIKGTLEKIASRQGVKEVDKRWVLFA